MNADGYFDSGNSCRTGDLRFARGRITNRKIQGQYNAIYVRTILLHLKICKFSSFYQKIPEKIAVMLYIVVFIRTRVMFLNMNLAIFRICIYLTFTLFIKVL